MDISPAEVREQPEAVRDPYRVALRAAFRRVIDALRDLADELDAAGLRPLGTTALNEAREFSAMMAAALQRLETSNDNQTGKHD